MEFTNSATKAAFKPLVEEDRRVFVPKTKSHGDYYGHLSDILPAVAETMISQGVNLLEKIVANPARTTPAKSATEA